MTLRLRPHHVLCSIGFEGSGYDGPFIANMRHIVTQVLRGPGGRDQRIWISDTADAICAPCPKRVGLGCESQDKIDRFDRDHAEALDLTPGQALSWGECHDRAVARVVPADLDRICAGCEWLPLGICKTRLAAAIAAQPGMEKGRPGEETAPNETPVV
ncbi:DUF1284 domain-containing protein [Jannaschia pohangensis]|uniref:DUF1284 domain-containing protein n=1 Tax=Jannaschia pohangensis TaxID=390807 RepID=A0A1I3HPA6_9RHOB|nr:DUF1284 domain-containing protein [Jannaschia pohangensis]SFI37350.1 hypothetical protein SAMN04488095_0665 [Jannaschia pohangensis]